MTRTAARGVVSLMIAVPLALAQATPASASGGILTVRKVDTSSNQSTSLTVMASPPATDTSTKITENKQSIGNITVEAAVDSGMRMGVVLVLDTSSTTSDRAMLEEEKRAAKWMISHRVAGEQFAIVASSAPYPRTLVGLSDDTNALTAAVDHLTSFGDSATWSGISMASALLHNAPTLQGNIVVLDGSRDDATAPTGPSLASATSDARSANASVFIAAVDPNKDLDSDSLAQIAHNTGGRYDETDHAQILTSLLADIQRVLASQSVIDYHSTATGALDIKVAVGSNSVTVHTGAGTVSEGAEVDIVAAQISHASAFFGTMLGRLMIAFIVLASVGLLTYGIIEIATEDRHQLSGALSSIYTDDLDTIDPSALSKIADSELLKRAVASTAKIASDRGLLEKIEARLAQADLPLKPAEAVLFTVVIAVIAMALGAVFFGFIGFVSAGAIFAYAPLGVTSFMAKRRRNKFTGQLPSTLDLLAGTLRAGYSLSQGFDAISTEVKDPMAAELKRAIAEARLGKPMIAALQDVSNRMQSVDFEWAVLAIKIQHEVGGNLSELLTTVGETMVSRERLRREVRALTAEGRLSSIILVGLPPSIAAIIWTLNPSYMAPLVNTDFGQMVMGLAVVSTIIGWFAMQKTINIKA